MFDEAAGAFLAAAWSEAPDGQRVPVSVGYDHDLFQTGSREFGS